jgi:ribosomal protein S27E/cytoskeletal protein CcmA (bactofilin family)
MMLRPKSPKKVRVTCGACGHVQWEYEEAAATSCRACGERIVMRSAGKKPAKRLRMRVERREIACLECGHIMAVPIEAQSWQCTACSAYLDLRDHVVAREHMTPVRTYGRVLVESKGVLGATRVECSGAEVAGRVLGRMICRDGVLVMRGEGRLMGGAEGKVLEVEAGARAEAAAGLEFERVVVRGRLKAREIRARQVEVAPGGCLLADALRAVVLQVEPGGWLEARVDVDPG